MTTRLAPGACAKGRLSPLACAVLVVAVLLFGTAQERTLGTITDEQQLLGTAFAIGNFGELGLARGPMNVVERPGGDAIAQYGLGLPIVEAPLMRAAAPFETAFGPASSQALLIALPLLLVAAAAACAGLLARAWGATVAGQVVAVLGVGAASPLWPLASTAFTEPLQALLLVAATLASVRSAEHGTSVSRAGVAWAALAGLCAAYAVLTKSVNAAIAPFTLVPLLLDRPIDADGSRTRRIRRAIAATCGAAPVLVAWLVLEIVRFGKPFGSYPGQGGIL